MTTVVGAGTGANYSVVAGALCALEEDGLVPKRLISTSGSGLPMAFRANGGTMREFLALAREHPPAALVKPNWRWPLLPGIFHLDGVREFIDGHVAPRFRDNKVPHTVIAYDSDAKRELLLGNGITDDMSVSLAVQASMSIPWVMRHVDVDGVRATDGGTVHNFAIDMPTQPAVGIRILGSSADPLPWRWWASYSWNHVDGMLRASERAHIASGLWKKHKILTVASPISGMDFHKVDVEMIERLFAVGHETVRQKLASGWGWRP